MKISAIFKTTLLAISFAALAACGQQTRDENHIKVGTMSGPETQLMETAKEVAAEKYGLEVEIIPFTDYAIPNEALAEGSIDVNMFQHKPYLEQAINTRGYKIVAIGKTFVYPMGIYSQKIKHLNELKEGSIVAIPNDPSNEGRALLLLEKAGLIGLKPGADTDATLNDITSNPKKLVFREIDAAQLPRTLPDVDVAAINTNYAMLAGLLPSRDALIIESPDSPYANLVVVREGDQDNEHLKNLVNALQSDAVLEKAELLFKGQAIPAWK